MSDHEPEEQKRRLSPLAALAPFEWEGHKINLIDTPGLRRLHRRGRRPRCAWPTWPCSWSARSTASRSRPRSIWQMAAELACPAWSSSTSSTGSGPSFERTLEQLRDRSAPASPRSSCPIGEEAAFRGVADLLTDTAFFYERRQGTTEARSPTTWRRSSTRCTTTSSRASSSPTTPARALPRRRHPAVEELEHTLAVGVADGHGVPRGVRLGRDRRRRRPARRLHLRDRPVARRPSPVTVTPATPSGRSPPTPTASRSRSSSRPSPTRTSGRSRCSRCCRAREARRPPGQPPTGADERLHGLFACAARSRTRSPSVPAGDIGAVAKLAGTATGDTLAPKGTPVASPAIEPPPAGARASRSGRARRPTTTSSARAAPPPGGGPGARASSATTRRSQTMLRGTGETHLAIALERLAPQVRRRRRHRGGAGALPRDDHAAGRGRGQVQEAVRWPRPVRRARSCASSRCPAARASSSSTPSWAARSPGSTSPQCRRASRRRWRPVGCTATRSST